MKTSIYEADPFSGSKGEHYLTIDTDYRFEKNDEVWLETGGRRIKIRVTYLWIGARFYFFVRYYETGGQAAFVPRPPGVEGWRPIAGLMNLKYAVVTGSVPEVHPAGMFLLVAFVGISLVARKASCSWLCPIGTLSEWLWEGGREMFGRNVRAPRWLDIPLRGLKYLLLGFFGNAVASMTVPDLQAFITSPYGLVADVKMLNFFRHIGTTGAVVVAILVVGSVFVKNLWCRYLCPYGALVGIAALFTSRATVRREDLGPRLHCRRHALRRGVEHAHARLPLRGLLHGARPRLRADRDPHRVQAQAGAAHPHGAADHHAALRHRPRVDPDLRPLGPHQSAARVPVRLAARALDLRAAGRAARAGLCVHADRLSRADRRRRRRFTQHGGGGADAACRPLEDVHDRVAAPDAAWARQRVPDQLHRVDVADGLFTCTSCRACWKTCPKDIQIPGKAIEKLRALANKEGLTLPRHQEVAKLIQETGRSVTRTEPTLMEQVPDIIEPRGEVKGTVGFFVGCMYNQRLPKSALDALEVLKRNGIRVIIPREQVCCGSPLIRTGQIDFLDTIKNRNINCFTFRGLDVDMTMCVGCGSTLKHDYATPFRVMDWLPNG